MPFANSFAPGPKNFDIYLNQVSYKTERTQTADLSKGYYFVNQALVVLKDSPLAKATTIAELKDYVYRRPGRDDQPTTRSASSSRRPRSPLVYDTNDPAIEALENKPIDGLVVDLPTAYYITNVQVDERHHRRPVRGRHAGALQRRPRQGQPADRVRRTRRSTR